jgi:hypothetical protein
MVFRTGDGIAVVPRRGGGRWLTIGASPPLARCGLDVTLLRRIVVCAVFGYVTLAVWLACPRAAVAAHWSLEHTSAPAHTKDSDFFGVSCASRSACTAVGDLVNGAGTGLTLAERWNGVRWSIQRTPNRAVDSGLLGGFEDVSCTSPSQCIATGSADALPLAAQWNGVSWAIQRTPEAPAGGDLQSVSCTSVTFCVATGWLINGATLTEHWDGVSWSIQQTPQPVGARDSTLQDISCASITACTAVGYYTSRTGNERTLAEHWNGVSWSIQQTPQRAGAKDSDLFGISCASITACTAVGYYTSRTHKDRMLAERWDGVSWSIERTPQPTGAKDSDLFGISCTKATVCTAVGSFTNRAGTTVPLAEHWNGVSWSIHRTPRPVGATDSDLDGTSCTRATVCTAVGSFTNRAGTTMPLAEHYA